ncbi:acetolactate synthase, large subunit, biosynthetic type [Candidatus Desantisbacteria bacterium CG1_02_38_46]|uniref:Acetolactate synthase n=3 Tax=unclassified Candidatus Desantisiibacteriota TaxID=3106372 RepID=A0A2H9P9Y8_9BACT|nr:MAG: acetolactate synthase, large subunit, biosynthetic type [Candidatus Desantisbacteria bacterium CG1_02_38_46]PIU51825.1 MAG: acetolactate synthase, large subunit, biosynthetic type [Candidatus Desantisbacteria bacterium CG07_land_8_20_14_0_80_39_15]PIZ15157.1 MAG: acetolactate synthase, large subunit, biosynthetic type [Candidatus Desantisbacteria bacterium CG_4_10_14_0_8_um_filter_39_17]
MKKTGAQILIESLIKEGVEIIFGYPGGATLSIYDALYDAPIKHILVRHEQGAAHMADGYARATGKVGVCMATSGPGATNLVTGIATAYMDSVPIIAITGQVPTPMIGNDAFQEADITGITRPITKHNYLVKDVKDLAYVVKEAFYIAFSGRPGPVLIDIPKDVQAASTEYHYPDKISLRSYNPTYYGHPGQIKKLVEVIQKSERPVIYAGGGVIIANASEELKKFAETTGIPVTTTLLGLGGFPETSNLSLGMLGMHGTRYANYAVTESDLLIGIGARFDDRVTGKLSDFAPKATIVHIDIDPTSISKSVEVDIPIVGDVKNVLVELNKLVKKKDNLKPWLDKIEKWKKEYPLGYKQGKEIKPQFVVQEISRITKGNAIIATEVGQNQMWSAQFYKFAKPRTFLSSGGLGTMGYGFPASIGAKVGCPDKIVFDIAGDGSFQMNLQQLATAVQFKIAVKVAILNNGFLGMVRQWQELFFNKRYSQTPIENPDFVKIAQAYGAMGIRVTKPEDVGPAISKAIESPLPVVIDFHVAPEENVFPMVPVGSPISEMIGGLA